RLERQGPLRQRADGAGDRGERRAGSLDRPDARARGALSGLGAGRELRRALAELEGAGLEGRARDARRARELDRRPPRAARRHAPTRRALRGARIARGARRRRHGALYRHALADQRPFCALSAGREEKTRRHVAEDEELVRALGRDLRGEPAADPRAPRARDAAADPDHAGLARRQRAARAAGEVRRHLSRGRRRMQARDLRELRPHVGRRARPADRPRPRNGQGLDPEVLRVKTDFHSQVEALRPYLLRFASLQLRNREAAEDAVQETLLAALAAEKSFAARSNLRTWLTGILKHKIVDAMRRSARERPPEADLSTDDLDALFDASGHWRDPPQ